MQIMLCCSDGMSTSLLVEKMLEVTRERGVDIEIWAVSLALLPSYVEKAPDVIMMGPQVKYKLKSAKEMFKNTECKVEAIDMRDYGAMRGAAVLDAALSLVEKKHE